MEIGFFFDIYILYEPVLPCLLKLCYVHCRGSTSVELVESCIEHYLVTVMKLLDLLLLDHCGEFIELQHQIWLVGVDLRAHFQIDHYLALVKLSV